MSSLSREQRPRQKGPVVPDESSSIYAAWAGRRPHWTSRFAALAWAWIRENPGWLASAALHLSLAIFLSFLLLNAPREQPQLGIEASMAGDGGGGTLENILDGSPAVEITSAPV